MDIPETINTPVITDAKKSNKKPLIVLVVAIILGLGGASYWYVMIYQPTQYAKAIFALETEIQAYGAQSGQTQFRWRYDYETALSALDKHEAFFFQFKKINGRAEIVRLRTWHRRLGTSQFWWQCFSNGSAFRIIYFVNLYCIF